MSQIDFYHLTQSDVESVLVMLVQKSLLAGKTVLVQCPRPAAEAGRTAPEWPPVALFVGLRTEVRRRYAAARASEDSLALARRKAEPKVAFEV